MQGRQGRRSEMNLKYNVVISEDALTDLRRCVSYLVHVKKNPQAASNLLDDYDETKKMRQRELRRINFRHHNYFMLYRLNGQTAYITNVFTSWRMLTINCDKYIRSPLCVRRSIVESNASRLRRSAALITLQVTAF